MSIVIGRSRRPTARAILEALFFASALAACEPNIGMVDAGLGGPSGSDGSGDHPTSIGVDRLALSGTRLKVRYVAGEDGSQVYKGMFDTQRNEECFFGIASDGQLRCIPTFDRAASASGYFSDAACTSPVFVAVCAANLGYIYNSTCPTQFRIFTLNTGLPPQTYIRDAQASCVATTLTPIAGYTYYTSAGEIAPSSFARGDVVNQP